jgi:hypothetical protein
VNDVGELVGRDLRAIVRRVGGTVALESRDVRRVPRDEEDEAVPKKQGHQGDDEDGHSFNLSSCGPANKGGPPCYAGGVQKLARALAFAVHFVPPFVILSACDREVRAPAVPQIEPPALATLAEPPPSVPTAGRASDPAGVAEARARVQCVRDPSFSSLWRVSEASAAAEVSLVPGTRELLVLSDSGNAGEGLLWAIPHGPFRPIRLALDATASDDIEGAAWSGGHLYTLTSSGAVRRFRGDGRGGLEREGDAYAIGPAPYACSALTNINCGMNYEGLCLRSSSARCAGYAASKSQGQLFCVVFDHERLRIDPQKPPLVLDVAHNALSDCTFGAGGGPAKDILLVTTNLYGGSKTYQVDEATGRLLLLDVAGLPNNEAIAVDSDGSFYELMDSDSRVSFAYRMTCKGW